MALTYADAVVAIEGAPDAPFSLPAYTGGQYDLDYLRSYVLNLVQSVYGAPANEFDAATEYSTTILRDFLNRAIFFQASMPARANVTSIYPQYEDVAGLLRYPAGDSCGGVAFQLYQIYRAFGYDSAYVGTIDGGIGLAGTPTGYNGSHVTTTVCLDGSNQWIVQDAYCNYTLRDSQGQMISLGQAREIATHDPDGVIVDGLDQFLYYRLDGGVSPIRAADEAAIRDSLFSLQQSWFIEDPQSPGPFAQQNVFLLYPDWTTAHTAIQGGTFDTKEKAIEGVLAAADSVGFDWAATANTLRPHHYVSGFQLVSPDGSWIKSQWITVQLANGSYVSVNLANGQALDGSYDQLVLEATGERSNINLGDQSDFLLPAKFMSAGGITFADWVANDVGDTTVVVVDDDANVYAWDTSFIHYTTSGTLAWQTFRYDTGGWLDIAYDLEGTQPWWDAQSRFDADGRLDAQRFDYDAGGYVQIDYDVSNKQTWAELERNYNNAGQLLSQRFNYDLGGWLDQLYDVGNAQPWWSAQYRYNATGARDATRFDYDSGGFLKTYYDTTGSQPWWDAQYRYDAAGRLDATRFDFDAGGFLKTYYDVNDTSGWSNKEQLFNAAGQMLHQTFDYDNGGWLDIDYDVTDAHDWSNYQSRYSPSGVIEVELIVYDDGHVVRNNYHDGILV